MKIVFFGTSEFAARLLTYLLDHNIEIVAVVTRPDKPRGRSLQLAPPPVKEALQKQGYDLPIHQPKKASTEEFETLLKQYQADLFLVVAYGEIIKQNLLSLPPLGCINVHASLLPAYRGAAPMQRALMDGVTVTGVTIMEMVLEMDAGNIIETAEIPVPNEMNLEELQEKLYSLSGPLLLKVISNLKVGRLTTYAQDSTKVTFAPKITAEEEVIHWARSANQIHNQIRALSPFPGTWCQIKIGNEIKRFKIKKSRVIQEMKGVPGTVLSSSKGECIVACGQGALRLEEVQLEGKKTMPIQDFLRGNSDFSFPNI